jgi:ABC-type bacteriocin/lantibiotic exporter with double-glycine peptidase domain
MTRLVQQQNDKDCALCCLAMLYDTSYEEMMSRIGVQAFS